MSGAGGNVNLDLYSFLTKSVSLTKYSLSNSSCKAVFHPDLDGKLLYMMNLTKNILLNLLTLLETNTNPD